MHMDEMDSSILVNIIKNPRQTLTELGIAFIISLLIDTFIIRNIYFPAMISILFRDKNHNHKQP